MRVLLCQLEVTQKRDLLREWVEYGAVSGQLDACLSLIHETGCGLAVLPETCYFPELFERYIDLSTDSVIVAGSAYNGDGINETHIFEKGTHRAVRKLFSSPKEVMEINYPNVLKPDAIVRDWEREIECGECPDYFAQVPDSGKYIAILTCMDYYRLSYYLANSSVISPLLWGIASPCSNGQQDLFLRLSAAVHDTNEKLYSLVVNSVNHSRAPGSDQGGSYVYGPLTANVRQHLTVLGQMHTHPSAIYMLGGGASALSMQLVDGADVTFFARSKDFVSNPTHIQEFCLSTESE